MNEIIRQRKSIRWYEKAPLDDAVITASFTLYNQDGEKVAGGYFFGLIAR